MGHSGYPPFDSVPDIKSDYFGGQVKRLSNNRLGQINPRCQIRTIKYIMTVTVAKGYVEIDQEFCKGCQLCIPFCPKGSIYVSENLNTAGYQPAAFNGSSKCTGCAICALVCPEVAIEVFRD